MEHNDILIKNKSLKDIHKGRRCFIIGNGPSLKQQDLLLLKNEIKIVVSGFYNHKDCRKINPNYWLIIDPLFWTQPETFLKPIITFINEKNLITKLFAPTEAFDSIKKILISNLTTNFDIHYLKYDPAKNINDDINFSQSIIPYGQNVISVALMLSFYLGCNLVYLIGCDHSWWGWKRNDYENKHMSHFYASQSIPTSQRLTYDALLSTIMVQKFQYLQLKKYAQKRRIQIFNGTNGGYLDLFQRVNFENLFPFNDNDNPKESKCLLSAIPDISSVLGRSAIKLINENEPISALVLINEAIFQNLNKDSKIEGLDYLRSICLMKMGKMTEAIQAAQQDFLCNESNRENSIKLLKILEGKNIYNI